MGSVTGYRAERMKEIEDATIVNGEIDASHHLILTRHDETEVDAGVVFYPEPAESAYHKIAEVELSAASTMIDFMTIPQTFKSLKVFASLRGDQASAFVGALLQLNNVSSDASYYRQYIQGNGATAAAQEALAAANSRQVGLLPANTATAGMFGQLEITIADYADAGKMKPVSIIEVAAWGSATGNIHVRHSTLVWASLNAINRIQLLASAGNLVSGSMASLYGLKSAI